MVMAEENGGLNGSSSSGSSNGSSGVPQQGYFVVWQMIPDKWLIELVVSGHKITAGSGGNVAWRRTPCLGSHVAKGGVRPLQARSSGIRSCSIAAVFSAAQFMGEKKMDEDCFALKLSANQTVLTDQSDSTAEIIKQIMIGHFSQRSGLLVYLEDSHLTRFNHWDLTNLLRNNNGIKCQGLQNGGVMIAPSGHSTANLKQRQSWPTC